MPSTPAPHLLLRQLLAGQGPEDGKFRWHHVLALMAKVGEKRSADSAALLQEIAEFEGRLVFDGRHGHPHSMPPADLLRILAIQMLAQWDRTKYRAAIVRAGEVAQTHPARAIARRLLR
ncbi:MAG TPA: hypothetical protein VGQ73_07695 [Gemmatimonadales bacterium]|jgi:hypothetical protein|nr:hypothetical protein [Gemmatimonadales bacterium]